MDLVAVTCELSGVRVVPLAAGLTGFEPYRLENGEGSILTSGGSPHSAVGNMPTQELLVADGVGGLGVLDLRAPGGSVDVVEPVGIDDRVLLSYALRRDEALGGGRGVAYATRVATYIDAQGRRVAVIATGRDGVFFVQVGPAKVELVRAWEVGNEANFIPNHKPYCEEGDARVEPEALYLVEKESPIAPCSAPSSWCLQIELSLKPGVPRESVYWKVFLGDQQVVPVSGPGQLPASGPALVEISVGPARSCSPNGPTADGDEKKDTHP